MRARCDKNSPFSAACGMIFLMDVNDYLIDHSKLEWHKMLSAWSWLLDDEAEPLQVHTVLH